MLKLIKWHSKSLKVIWPILNMKCYLHIYSANTITDSRHEMYSHFQEYKTHSMNFQMYIIATILINNDMKCRSKLTSHSTIWFINAYCTHMLSTWNVTVWKLHFHIFLSIANFCSLDHCEVHEEYFMRCWMLWN